MLEELKNLWPIVWTLLTVLFGGAVTWATVRLNLATLLKGHDALTLRVNALETAKENDRIMIADRLARIEVKLDSIHIQSESKR